MERFHRLDLEGLCMVHVYRLISTQRILSCLFNIVWGKGGIARQTVAIAL